MKSVVVQVLGWYGVLAVLAGYGLMTFGIIDAHGTAYVALNLTGAACIVLEAASRKDYQAAVLNIVWTFIALFAIIKLLGAFT